MRLMSNIFGKIPPAASLLCAAFCGFFCANIAQALSESEIRSRMQKLATWGQDPILKLESQMSLTLLCKFPKEVPQDEMDFDNFALFTDRTYKSSTSNSRLFVKGVLFRSWEELNNNIQGALVFSAGEVLRVKSEGNVEEGNSTRTLFINGWRKNSKGLFLDGFIEDMLRVSCAPQGCAKTNTLLRFDAIQLSQGKDEDVLAIDGFSFPTGESVTTKSAGLCTFFDDWNKIFQRK